MSKCQCDLTMSFRNLFKVILSFKKVTCQSIKMLELEDECLWFFFFLCNSKQTESFSSSAPYIPRLSWKSLAAALPDGESALWSRPMFSAFPLQHVICESNTCPEECHMSSGEWLMPCPFVVGVLFLTRGAPNWAKPFGEQLYCFRHFSSGVTISHFFMLQSLQEPFFVLLYITKWDSTVRYGKIFQKLLKCITLCVCVCDKDQRPWSCL